MSDILDEARALLKARYGYDDFRPAQADIIESIAAGFDTFGFLPTGYGKCLGENTPILMYDGRIKYVQDVKPGDYLLGPDGQKRLVLNTTSGYGKLFRVTPIKGDPYVVNENHILSLKTTPTGKRGPKGAGGRIVNVSIKDWLASSKTFKHTHKGWRAPADFPTPARPLHPDLPPYVLGVWLGDGHRHGMSQITNVDEEVRQAMREYAESIGLQLVRIESDSNKFNIGTPKSEGGGGPGTNRFITALRDVGIRDAESKHIPPHYLTASRKCRLELLAGLIDTDGYLSGANGLDIIQKSENVANGVAFLCRSLGLAAYVSPCEKHDSKTGGGGKYFRVSISGDTEIIPSRVKRRKASSRKQKKNPLVTGIKVEEIDPGRYYGFEVDRDHLFMLGDFTVTHNSVTFQIPSMMFEGLTIVVSPLIALMKDQCDDLTDKGIPAAFINSTQTTSESTEVMYGAVRGDYKLLYIAPERINNKAFQTIMSSAVVSLIAVDEAHSASRWGHDFRPAYMQIKRMVKLFTRDGVRPVILAITATATPEVEEDIRKSLGLSNKRYRRFAGDPVRPNFSYRTSVNPRSAWQELCRLVMNNRTQIGGRHLVYSVTRNGAAMAAKVLLEQAGMSHHVHNTDPVEIGLDSPIQFYHAGMTPQHRTEVQERFKDGRAWCVCATNAFGMGIDVPDIRTVTHLGIPGSVEDYVQEAGRGGRDGKATTAFLIVDDWSIQLQQNFIDNANPPAWCYEAFWNWANAHPNVCGEGQEVEIPTIHLVKKINTYMGLDSSNQALSLNADKLRGLLAVLESQGVLVRGSKIGHIDMTVELEITRQYVGSAKSGSMLHKMAVSLMSLGGGRITTDVNRLAATAGIPSDKVAYTLAALEKKRCLTREPTFTGKSFTIEEEHYGRSFADVVDVSEIARNRDRALARLESMLAYVEAPNKPTFIRQYFTEGLKMKPAGIT